MTEPQLPEEAANFQSRFFSHEGQRIHYIAGGRGPLIILAHGGLSDGGSFIENGVATVLAKSFRVVAPDALGHGKSDKPDDARFYDLEHCAARLVAVMDELGAERAHILGYSMGAWAASGVAVHHPDRLESLTIAGWDLENGVKLALRAWGVETIDLEFCLEGLRLLAPHVVEAIPPDSASGMRHAIDAINHNEGAAAAVAALSVPVLLWDGVDDPYFSPSRAFAARYRFQFLSTPGDHIAAFEQHGAEAAVAIESFLTKSTRA